MDTHAELAQVGSSGDPLVMLGGTALAIAALALIGRIVTSRL